MSIYAFKPHEIYHNRSHLSFFVCNTALQETFDLKRTDWMDSIRLRKHAQTIQTSSRDKSLKTLLKISNKLRGSANNGEGWKEA